MSHTHIETHPRETHTTNNNHNNQPTTQPTHTHDDLRTAHAQRLATRAAASAGAAAPPAPAIKNREGCSPPSHDDYLMNTSVAFQCVFGYPTPTFGALGLADAADATKPSLMILSRCSSTKTEPRAPTYYISDLPSHDQRNQMTPPLTPPPPPAMSKSFSPSHISNKQATINQHRSRCPHPPCSIWTRRHTRFG